MRIAASCRRRRTSTARWPRSSSGCSASSRSPSATRKANYFIDAFDVDRIRRDDPRPFPALPVIDVDPDVTPECIPFLGGGAAQEEDKDHDILTYADAGGVPAELDLRPQVPETLRTMNRELLRMGGARRLR